jgi:serine/threonine protein kinase
MAEDLPQEFGNYTLHKLIARGGMAEIYRATMPGIGGFEKTVAIKKILPHLAENDEFITMLKDEANILVSISHSNIAQVYDLGKIEDTYFISMEYVHGLDLSHVVKAHQKRGEHMPVEHAVYIGSCMCAGLHAAHTNTDKQGNPLNIVHRDVSPHNVIISYAGDVKLIDFGVAKAAVKESHTQMGVIKGKLLYMAPEQAMAKNLDGRADLFAVGLCMYKMLTHELPFRGDNEFQIYNNILSKEIVPPRQINPQVPEEVNQIVMTLLQRDPDKRYQDGYSAKQELERALHNVAPGYTVNRLSRFIEDNFSEAAQKEQQDAQDISGPTGVAPQTPSANSVGTGQLTGGDQIPELDIEFEPDSLEDTQAQRQRVHAQPQGGSDFGAPTPPPQPSPQGQDSSFRTQTNRDSTGNFNVEELADGPKSESKSGPPPAVYAIGALLLVIVGLIAYGLYFTDVQPGDDGATEQTQATTAAESPTVQVSLDSAPNGAAILRGEDVLGRTPHQLTLVRTDEPITLTLRKDGFEDQVFQLIPDSDINQAIDLEPAEDSDEGASAELNFGEDDVDDPEADDLAVDPALEGSDGPTADGIQQEEPVQDEPVQNAPDKMPTKTSRPARDDSTKPKPDKPKPDKPKPDKPSSKDSAKPAKPEPKDDGLDSQAPPPKDDAPSLFDDDPVEDEPAKSSGDTVQDKQDKQDKQDEQDNKKQEPNDIIDPFG